MTAPDERLRGILRDAGLAMLMVPVTAEKIIDFLDEMGTQRCADPDCVIRREHSALGPHLWKHPAEAPFSRMGRCAGCGEHRAHRVHRTGGA